MTLENLNNLEIRILSAELAKCCGSAKWVFLMAAYFPFSSEDDLMEKAETLWLNECGEGDWLEALAHHPKIGATSKNLEKDFAATKDWAAEEQSGVQKAGDDIISELAKANKKYEEKFGFIFIVCATGKTADEMLDIIKHRLPNDYKKELHIAAGEQNKITQLRLKKLLA